MVEHITYQGERLPVKLGYYALKMLQQEHGVNLNETTEGPLELYEPMIYYALKQGFKAEKKEFTFEMDDMVDILDDCLFEFIALIPKFFPEEMAKLMGAGGQTPSPTRKRTVR